LYLNIPAVGTRREAAGNRARNYSNEGMVVDWAKASAALPQPKALLNMRNNYDIM